MRLKLRYSLCQQIFKAIGYAVYPKDSVLFKEGELSNGKMYVIINGVVKIAMKKNMNVFISENLNAASHDPNSEEHQFALKYGMVVARLTKGQAFGEKAILISGGVFIPSQEKIGILCDRD